ncbi:MAG: hypothetical protein R2787_12575 [Saprospiraceae bacterium]|nr:hypothetical protein [Saprospiraceae bacterium]MCB9311575.1 hypothetical protein [Lewinellaceae bacterium]HRW74555.1 hypothetical protein [Saprospiraceae bacterium]
MKRLIAFALPLLFLVACNSVEKYRSGIESLATQWDQTTASVTEVAQMVTAEQANFDQNLTSMVVAEDAMAKLKDDKKNMVMDAFNALQTSGASFGTIAGEVNDFVTNWTAKADQVNALKEGLANGKLEGDVTAQIAELTNLVTEAGTKVTSWKEQIEAAKAGIASKQEAYQTVVAEIMPSK